MGKYRFYIWSFFCKCWFYVCYDLTTKLQVWNVVIKKRLNFLFMEILCEIVRANGLSYIMLMFPFISVLLSEFAPKYPANNYLFKVNNRNTRNKCEICLTLTIKTPERR